MIDGVIALYIFMLAAFTGYEVISRVPVILHTPLMSGSQLRARHRAGRRHGRAVPARTRRSSRSSASSASCSAAGNAVGGYVVTERMLEMFKSSGQQEAGRRAALMSLPTPRRRSGSSTRPTSWSRFLFILGLKRMSSPVTARGGILWAGVGMVLATLVTFLAPVIGGAAHAAINFALVILAIADRRRRSPGERASASR